MVPHKIILANSSPLASDKAIHGSLCNPASSQFQLEKWRSSPWGRHYYRTANHPHAAIRYPRDLAGSKQPRLHGDTTERESVCGCYQLPRQTSSESKIKIPRATNDQIISTEKHHKKGLQVTIFFGGWRSYFSCTDLLLCYFKFLWHNLKHTQCRHGSNSWLPTILRTKFVWTFTILITKF